MTESMSGFSDPDLGGYHASWRTEAGDKNRKVPHDFFYARRVNPPEQSTRGDWIALRWAEGYGNMFP
jgi:hypothetical protein